VFYLVKIEPRVAAIVLLTRALRALLGGGEESMLAHWMLFGPRAIMSGGASIAASFSMGVRPRRAIEKRSSLYRYSQAVIRTPHDDRQ
jgi:hypothetical protein